MANINLNAATYEQIVTLLSRLATNYSNLIGTFYDVFYNENPENVTFKMFDESGTLKDFTVKNLALSNDYRKTGEGIPHDSSPKGTLYQDLSNGDLYIKRTEAEDDNQYWAKIINKALLDGYILHGTGDPNGQDLDKAEVGTLYVDTALANLYICTDTDSKTWAPFSVSPVLEFAKRDLSNISDAGKGIIQELVVEEVGTKATVIDSSTSDNGHYTTALAVQQAIEEATGGFDESISQLDTGKQDKSNLVTSISASSTDMQYPSAKCIYDLIGNLASEIDAL